MLPGFWLWVMLLSVFVCLDGVSGFPVSATRGAVAAEGQAPGPASLIQLVWVLGPGLPP